MREEREDQKKNYLYQNGEARQELLQSVLVLAKKKRPHKEKRKQINPKRAFLNKGVKKGRDSRVTVKRVRGDGSDPAISITKKLWGNKIVEYTISFLPFKSVIQAYKRKIGLPKRRNTAGGKRITFIPDRNASLRATPRPTNRRLMISSSLKSKPAAGRYPIAGLPDRASDSPAQVSGTETSDGANTPPLLPPSYEGMHPKLQPWSP